MDNMKLVFIYGPHAAGKYTVGRELAKLTGYKFFHNHLTVNVVDAIFPETGPKRSELLCNFRAMLTEEAAKAGRDTILTVAYSGAVDDEFVAKVVGGVEKHGGEVCFVQLYAPPETLLERIGNDSRKQLGKMSRKSSLKQALETRDLYAAVKHKPNLRLDTTKYSPERAAAEIVRHYGLS